MLLSFKEGLIDSRAYSKFSYPEFDIYLSGFIFCRKLKAGKETLDFLAKELQETHAVPFAKLFGKFAVVIYFRDSDKYLAFTDNSSMHGMFITTQSLGSNFLELAKHDGLNHFDDVGVAEYITMTWYGLSGHALLEGIKFTSNFDYYEIQDGTCKVLSKGIEDIDGKSSIDDPFEFFGDVAHAVSDMKAACSLTGGYDSRMVATVMNAFGKFDCAMFGDNDKTKDITCSNKAAEAGGFKKVQIRPAFSVPTDESTQKLLMRLGGYQVRLGSNADINRYFLETIAKEGFEIVIDGNDGEFHKDFWFTQDLLSYWSKKTNCKRFYDGRMKEYSPYFGQFITDTGKAIEQINLNKLHELRKDRNTQSYLFYGWKMFCYRQLYQNLEIPYIVSYPVLHEIELVRYSYSILPKGKRMDMFHRQMTTRANKKVARVPTCYGTTASSEPLYLFRDVFIQGLVYAKKALKYFIRRLFKVHLFLEDVLIQTIDPQLRALNISRNAVQWAKEKGYLNDNATAENIPIALLEKMINLHFLSQELGC